MSRTTLEAFKERALQNEAVKNKYDLLKPEYEIKRKLIAIRKEAGLTQEALADRMGTKKSNISRLESFKNTISPKLSTLMQYAEATRHQLKIDFI